MPKLVHRLRQVDFFASAQHRVRVEEEPNQFGNRK